MLFAINVYSLHRYLHAGLFFCDLTLANSICVMCHKNYIIEIFLWLRICWYCFFNVRAKWWNPAHEHTQREMNTRILRSAQLMLLFVFPFLICSCLQANWKPQNQDMTKPTDRAIPRSLSHSLEDAVPHALSPRHPTDTRSPAYKLTGSARRLSQLADRLFCWSKTNPKQLTDRELAVVDNSLKCYS